MNREVGDLILRLVRGNSLKPFDKEYILDAVQQNDAELVARKKSRDEQNVLAESRYVAGDYNRLFANRLVARRPPNSPASPAIIPLDSLQLAQAAAREVSRRGGSAFIGRVGHPVDHAFCVADFCQSDERPGSIRDMSTHPSMDAWVIDPWVNISCRFHEYPPLAMRRFVKWNNQGKHILKTGLGEERWYSPSGMLFWNAFFTGTLELQEFEDPLAEFPAEIALLPKYQEPMLHIKIGQSPAVAEAGIRQRIATMIDRLRS